VRQLLSFRKWYLMVLILFIVSNLLLFFYLQPFIYRICGYSPRLIGKISTQAFDAYQLTAKARISFFKFLIFLNCLVLLLSFLDIRMRRGKKPQLSKVVLVLSILLVLLFLLVIRQRGLEGMEVLGSAIN
jgi:hypothetical protein